MKDLQKLNVLAVVAWPTLSIKMNSCKHKCEDVPGDWEDTIGSECFSHAQRCICVHTALTCKLSSLQRCLFLAVSLAFCVFLSSMQTPSAVFLYGCVAKCKCVSSSVWKDSMNCKQENKFQQQVANQGAFYTQYVNQRCEPQSVSAPQMWYWVRAGPLWHTAKRVLSIVLWL